MRRALLLVGVALVACGMARAQEVPKSDGWVVIPVEEYRALRLKAYPPERPPEPPPVDATLTRIDYELHGNGDALLGEARLAIDVLKEGWVAVEIPAGLLVRAARLDGRPISIIDAPSPHVLLSKPGRVQLSLDIVVPPRIAGGSESLVLPASASAVSRLALVIARPGIDLTVAGGVLSDRPQDPAQPWIIYGRPGQPMTVSWKKRTEDTRTAQPLRIRGSVTELVSLGEESSLVNATVRIDVVQGLAQNVAIALPAGFVVNQVSGAPVSDWDFRAGSLTVNFLEPIAGAASFAVTGESRLPREGSVPVPLLRLPKAEREAGGVAVEVVGAGEIRERTQHGLEAADPSDLLDVVSGRESPSMVAFRYRAQDGAAARDLAVTVARYTAQAVLVANIEEARYQALAGEDGRLLVRARYAVRNNQRAFLAITLPPNGALWSAAVAGHPLRPGVSSTGAVLLPREKGRAGEEAPAFAAEIVYVQQIDKWQERGKTQIVLPAVDLPISRTGVLSHYSPRFSVTPEPGAFRVETDEGPFTQAVRLEDARDRDRGEGTGTGTGGGSYRPSPPAAKAAPTQQAALDALVAQYRKDSGGRTAAGVLPVRIVFPEFGSSVFLVSELTPEGRAASFDLSYKKSDR